MRVILGLILVALIVAPFAPEVGVQEDSDHVQQAGFWFTLLLVGVFYVLNEFLAPKPEQEERRPTNLGDFQFPTADEGRPVPIIWGTVKIKGPNVVWYGDFKETAVTETQKTGLFSKETFVTGYRYNIGIQFALCRGPVDAITGVFIGEEQVFSGSETATISINEPELFGGDELGQGGVQGDLTIFLGSESQNASTYLSSFQAEGGDTPAYRGTCYLVWEKGYVGNSTSIKQWSFEARRIPNGLGLSDTNAKLNSNNDANPINVLYEIITNGEWGLGFAASDIDTTNFTTAATTLASENNGLSMSLESTRDALSMIREIERQIDGVLFYDRTTGQFKVNLARPGQTPIGSITEANLLNVQSYSRQAWENTSNQVRVKYSSRNKEYEETYALAQDMANFQIVGKNTSVDTNYPGVKDPDLAANIAWRDLRTLAQPLAKAVLEVDRTFHAANLGDVVEWTDANLGITSLDMRILKVDLGDLTQGRIILEVVEDVFSSDTASFSAPQPTGWVKPSDTVVDIPANNRAIFEAPKAFIDRDPESPGVAERIWVGCRSQGKNEVWIIPNVDGNNEGVVVNYLLIGELNAAVTRNSTASIVLNSDVDSATLMAAEFSNVTNTDKGVSLAQIVLINDEFIFIDNASAGAGLLTMTSPTRGVLDSVPAEHAAGDLCYLLFVAGNLTTGTFANGNRDVKPLPKSPSDELAVGSATATTVNMDNRHLKPYPPLQPRIADTLYNTGTVSLDTAISGPDDGAGFEVDLQVRRDYRTTDEYLAATGETILPADFPSVNTTQYRVEVIDDPDGTPTSLYHTGWGTDAGTAADPFLISRTEILANNSGVVPTRLRISVETRHTVDSVVYEADQKLTWDFNVSSDDLDGGDTAMGVAGNDTALPTAYVIPATGSYGISIGADVLVNGTVQYRINGGSWTNTLITSGTTSDSVSFTNTDSVEFRVTGETPAINTNTRIFVDQPSAGDTVEAYGVFTL